MSDSPLAAANLPLGQTRPDRMTDALIDRGIQLAADVTPGTWVFLDSGDIFALSDPSAEPIKVARVTERYSNEETTDDSAFVVEAVNHYEIALRELRALRQNRVSQIQVGSERIAESLRQEMRDIITRAEQDHRHIDPRDLYALAELPIVELAVTEDLTDYHCPNCRRVYHSAIAKRAISCTGPIRICECAIDRSSLNKPA